MDLALRSGEPVRVVLPAPSPDGLFMLTLPCDVTTDAPGDSVQRIVEAQRASIIVRVTTHGG